jgi:hypothetical protein
MQEIYKSTVVIPLLKKANLDHNQMANYRPVSNLSFISKTVERVVNRQLLFHIKSQSLVDHRQSAYRNHHSCETAIVSVADSAFKAMDSKKFMLLVLLDMSFAFDTIDHRILSDRLSECRVTGAAHAWIMSYLSNRYQAVLIHGVRSNEKLVTRGVSKDPFWDTFSSAFT